MEWDSVSRYVGLVIFFKKFEKTGSQYLDLLKLDIKSVEAKLPFYENITKRN